MKTLTKSMLALTLAGFGSGFLFVTGVIDAGNAVGWYMTLPMGAVFFGLFLICLMLEKEAALFDAEHRLHPAKSADATRDKPAKSEAHSGYSARPAH